MSFKKCPKCYGVMPACVGHFSRMSRSKDGLQLGIYHLQLMS